MYHEVVIPTKYGSIAGAVTSADHVCLRARDDFRPVYRGKPFRFYLHLYLIDGQWRRRPGEYFEAGDLTFKGKDIVEPEIIRGWYEFLAANPQTLKLAGINKAHSEARSALCKLKDAEKQLTEARANLLKARQTVAALDASYQLPPDTAKLTDSIVHEFDAAIEADYQDRPYE